jgi:hypothetical protein
VRGESSVRLANQDSLVTEEVPCILTGVEYSSVQTSDESAEMLIFNASAFTSGKDGQIDDFIMYEQGILRIGMCTVQAVNSA